MREDSRGRYVTQIEKNSKGYLQN